MGGCHLRVCNVFKSLKLMRFEVDSPISVGGSKALWSQLMSSPGKSIRLNKYCKIRSPSEWIRVTEWIWLLMICTEIDHGKYSNYRHKQRRCTFISTTTWGEETTTGWASHQLFCIHFSPMISSLPRSSSSTARKLNMLLLLSIKGTELNSRPTRSSARVNLR